MIPLSIHSPTFSRSLTYYDRCAIELLPAEMKSVRLRISVTILGTPQYRSLNLKYPFYKEFYGYMQAFYLGAHYQDFPINYSSQVVWDWWNEHGTIAHQLTSALQRIAEFMKVSIDFQEFVLPMGDSGDGNDLPAVRESVKRLTEGLTYERSGLANDADPTNDTVNTFEHPFNLIRLKFPFGTVFNVNIDSWVPGLTAKGATYGTPEETPPYDTDNPNGTNPDATPGSSDPENPYGPNPPDSNPLDPNLDPDDFSNAPEPGIPGAGQCLRISGSVQIVGIDGAARPIEATYGPYPDGFGAAWEFQQNTSTPPVRPLYRVRVSDSTGALVDYPITSDLLGTASLSRVECPP
jgi:hypothetical protein